MRDTTYEPMADEAIRLYRLCKEFHTLPSPGGILDQDYLLIYLIEAVSDAMVEYERLENEKEKNKSRYRGRRP